VLTILTITIPFFAVIGCGYFAGKFGILDRSSRAGLNGFVFYFALPVLLFSVMSGAKFEEGFEWKFPAAYALVSIVLFLLAFAVAKSVFKLNTANGAIHALGGVYGNTGYVGFPLIVVVFGSSAGIPVVVCLTIDLVLMIPIAMFFIEAGSGKGESGQVLAIIGKTLRALSRNPLILAILAGTAVSLSGLELPAVVQGFTKLLGAAAAPCALFALGSSLFGQPVRGAFAEVSTITVVKLVVHPLLVWYTMFEVFEVNELWGFAAVLASTMPVAATVYVLAQQYDTYVARASTAILLSTAVSIISITTILAYLPIDRLSYTVIGIH
jgi:malonate transporter